MHPRIARYIEYVKEAGCSEHLLLLRWRGNEYLGEVICDPEPWVVSAFSNPQDSFEFCNAAITDKLESDGADAYALISELDGSLSITYCDREQSEAHLVNIKTWAVRSKEMTGDNLLP